MINDAYAPHGISFNHVDTTRTVNAEWGGGQDLDSMKAELRQGDYSTLNVYTVDTLGGIVIGQCSFPEQVTEGDSKFLEDGCMIVSESMPGQSDEPAWREGGVLVHEVSRSLIIDIPAFSDKFRNYRLVTGSTCTTPSRTAAMAATSLTTRPPCQRRPAGNATPTRPTILARMTRGLTRSTTT